MAKDRQVMAVSKEFYDLLVKRQKEFNSDFAIRYFGKSVSLTQFTKILCDNLEEHGPRKRKKREFLDFDAF